MRTYSRLRWGLLTLLLLLVPGWLLAQAILINGSRVISGSLNYCADNGTTDTYACSLLTSPLGYNTGTRYTFLANTANTGAATLNLNSLGAKTIKKRVAGSLTDLDTGDIAAGQVVEVVYDGTFMVMVSQAADWTRTIASGAKALNTTTVTSGTCGTAQTATATGTATTDTVLASFNANITTVTGYTASTGGTLRIDVYPTLDTVNFVVCNNTLNDITPGGITLNWRVVR